MIIRSVRLNPFGGISNLEIALDKGINVVVGPNEAGKSTIYNGIQKALFTPSNLSRKAFEKEIKNHIPVGGGDTAKVEMKLLHNEELYILKKAWGGSRSSELHLPDGSLISEETAIDEKLRSLMAAGPGTYRWVLMTYQSGLARILEDLDNDPDTLHSLGDVIRKTVLETDGISVEKFKDGIEKLYGEYLEHWDRIQNFPESNRGIENPYKKGIGKVLSEFYKKESLRSRIEISLFYEEELDKINKILKACELEIEEKNMYIRENEKLVDDARNRKLKSSDFELKKAEISRFSEDNDDWVISENKIKELNEKLPLADAQLEKLEKERNEAKVKADNESLIQKFTRVEKCKIELDNAEKALKSIKKLENAELKSIRDSFNEVDRLKASFEAGKLRASFEARKTFTLTVQKDFEEEHSKEVNSGESFLLEAGGRLKLEHPEWKLEIMSGEEEIEKVLQSYGVVKQQKEDLLNLYGIQFLEGAEELNEIYNEALNVVNNTTSNFNKELGDISYEELFQKMGKISTKSGSEDKTRPLIEIEVEKTKLEGEIVNIENQLNAYRAKVNELTLKHESKKKLIIKLGKASILEEEIEREIRELTPLPEGLENDEAFIKQYESMGKELKNYNDKRIELLQERFNLEKEAPEESAEELQKQQKEAKADFQIVLRKAEAVARIRNLTQDLLAEIDSGTYEGLKTNLEQYVSFMTNERHTFIKMDEGKGLPCGFVRNDGAILDYELLSAGTKDVFSLALRLSMANYFLRESSGFLIMDDPFVDMDPERQQKAGQIIRKFARDKQVVIFTCHPTHAEILGGNQIHL